MTIIEALKAIQKAPKDDPEFRVSLVCGFTPLHLRTLLNAHLQNALADRRVVVEVGLYGDLIGTLDALVASATPVDAVAIALEWPDLDARTGFRSSGGWGLDSATDIVKTARETMNRVATAVTRLPSGTRVALSMPTLQLPPLFHTPGWEESGAFLELQAELSNVGAALAKSGFVSVLNAQRLALTSPPDRRYDVKSDLLTGLPFTLQHADAVALLLAAGIAPKPPKKGVITDLDDTLWSGIVGEVGPDKVAWDLSSHAQLHGLYQKLLASLSEHGTLVAVASKNDPAVVATTLEREDLLIRPKHIFPVEAHWNAKSTSVTRILEAWNIAADSVVFVDDSPMELAEVAAAHPGIECLLFPKNDPSACITLLEKLRDMCGKERVSQDDTLRLESLRQGAQFRAQSESAGAPDAFLEQAEAVVTFDFAAAGEPRVLELVNKTNQFNLNGKRYTDAEWLALTSHGKSIVAAVSYADKFGPLGTIAVAAGSIQGDVLHLDCWVMSCRAFARRIEHQMMKRLFESAGVNVIEAAFTPTSRNGPVQEFLTSLLGDTPTGVVRLHREQFDAKCPPLYHEVREHRRTEAHG